MDDDVVSQLLREKRARNRRRAGTVRIPRRARVPERSAPRSATAPYAPAPSLRGLVGARTPDHSALNASSLHAGRHWPRDRQPPPSEEATPRRPYVLPRPASGQPTAAEDELKMLIDVGGSGAAIGAALPIVTRLLKTVDWVKVLRSIEEGLRAKQERAIYRAVAITWRNSASAPPSPCSCCATPRNWTGRSSTR